MPKFFIRITATYSTNVEAIDAEAAKEMVAVTDLEDWSNDPEWSLMEVEAMEKPDDVIVECVNCGTPINLSIDGYWQNKIDPHYWCDTCSWIPMRAEYVGRY